MYTTNRPARLLLLALLPLGCSATNGGRAPFGSNLRTAATVGDKPLPAVTGEAGASVAAEEPEPDAGPRRDGRISGRVVDDRGDPVAGATVRIAEVGLRGGRVVRATTDRAGGYTLRGLRSGSEYTVVAELEDRQGVLSGRASALAPDSDVQIALRDVEAEPIAPRAARAKSRVESVSDRVASGREPSVTNPEDLPASSTEEPRRPAPSTSSGTRWHRGGSAKPTSEEVDRPPAPADDIPNPLPPALDPATEPAHGHDVGAIRAAPGKPVAEIAVRPPEPEPILASMVADTPTYDPFALIEDRPVQKTEARIEAPENVPDEPVAVQETPQPSRQETRRRPTWGEVEDSTEVAEGRTITKASLAAAVPPDPAKPKGQGRPIARALGRTRAPAPTQARVNPANLHPICKYDATQHRLLDFRLPDLQGSPVRLTDFDADYILLDFWGSWCEPCKDSAPHLAELQAKYGIKQIQVIGIACEKGTPEGRAARVTAAARKLGINYPVLLTEADPKAPVQKELQVQFYPTMILIDRQGRELWRAAGATQANLARLDRVVASSAKISQARR